MTSHRRGRLLGKRALVTGASSGIGAEISRVFAREGARVVLCHRDSKRHSDVVVDEIVRAGGSAYSVHGDVSDPKSMVEVFREVKAKLGGLDVLVNAAGLSDSSLWNAAIDEISLKDWQRTFSVDVFGTFLSVKEAVKLMKKGSIVNISSTPAVAGDSSGLVYASAKGAVLSMTRVLSQMLSPKVRVNCMVLGSIQTGWMAWLSGGQKDSYLKAIPLGRFGTPGDVASLALFLASEESDYITGESIIIDGGEVSR